MNSGKVILGTLAGLAAGALIGVLFAPDKGSESRSKILKEGEEYLDSLKKEFNSFLDSISGKFDGGREVVSEVAEKVNASFKRS